MIEGFFRTATDARYAIRDLRNIGLEPSVPTPVPPNNGRPWRVDVEPGVGAPSERFPKATLTNQVVGIILRHNGITDQAARV